MFKYFIFFICGLFFIQDGLYAQDIKYTSANNSWNADSLGNQRAIVQFNGEGKIAKVIIAWRRNDNDPQLKRIIVQDAKYGQKVFNVKIARINNYESEIYFEPTSGKGDYCIYYMAGQYGDCSIHCINHKK